MSIRFNFCIINCNLVRPRSCKKKITSEKIAYLPSSYYAQTLAYINFQNSNFTQNWRLNPSKTQKHNLKLQLFEINFQYIGI